MRRLVFGLTILVGLSTTAAFAVPYASLIRIDSTTVARDAGTTISYVLNEQADTVTINIKDAGAATVATFAGTTAQGLNEVAWDGTDNNTGGTPLPHATGYTIEITVSRNVAAGWFQYAVNNTMWSGFSGMDLAIPANPLSDLFGRLFASVATTTGIVGMQTFELDLGARLGSTAGDLVMVQPPGGTLAYTDYWGTDFDPDNMDAIFIGGQGTPSTSYADNSAGIQTVAEDKDTSDLLSSLFPRSVAVVNHTDGKYAYYAYGNASIRKVKLTATNAVDNVGTQVLSLANTARYSRDVEFDAAGNLYWCSRRDNTGGTNGRVMRWDAALVEAAVGGSLTDANASWVIDMPAGITNLKTVTITPAGDVYTAGSEGIYYIGNAATATLTKTLDAVADRVVDFAGGFNLDGGGSATWTGTSTYGSGIAADWAGNIYAVDRSTEITRAFSPGGNTTKTTAAPPSQTFSLNPVITNPAVIHQETAADDVNLRVTPASDDLINGIVATKISGSFYSIVTNPLDREPAFTDGAGLGALTGLLNDFPGEGTPAWSGFWPLASASDIAEVRIFSGNQGKDGRIFHNADIYVTTDATPTSVSLWTPLIMSVTPAAFGSGNPVAPNDLEACLSVVQANPGTVMATGITGIRCDFYAVSNTARQFRDQWGPTNPNDMDGLDFAFESPLMYEVDVYGTEQFLPPANVPDWSLY